MSDDAGQQTSLDEIVDEYTGKAEGETVDIGKLQEIDESPIKGWELRRLGEVFSLEYGENLTEDERDGGKYPVYGSNGQVGNHSKPYVDNPGIIVGRKGSIGEVEFSEGPFHPIDTTYYISQDETDENVRFIYYLLESVQLSRLNAASAIPGLNRNDAYSLKGLVPPLQEQRKIASVLYNVDKAIRKTEELVNQIKRVRRGVEQDILSKGVLEDGSHRTENEIEYESSWVGEIPSDWEIKEYSELITDSSVGIVVKPSQYYDDSGTVPILRSKDISRDGIVDGDFEYMTEESNAENENSQLHEGDIITVRSGDPGLSCVVSAEFDGANCADLLISTPGPKLNTHYAAMWINSFAGRKQIDRFQAGLAQKHFNLGALRDLRIAVPSLEEQNRIVQKISSITDALEQKRKYKEQLQNLKKGLMQDLLTGEVRIADADIKVLPEVEKHG